jgi:hypothetical protein
MVEERQVTENPCELNRWMQHLLAVYLPEFGSPRFFQAGCSYALLELFLTNALPCYGPVLILRRKVLPPMLGYASADAIDMTLIQQEFGIGLTNIDQFCSGCPREENDRLNCARDHQGSTPEDPVLWLWWSKRREQHL